MASPSITLTIRVGTSTRFTIPSNESATISLSSTILEVKQCITAEEAADRCPVERQRLIFKGRILSDDSRTLSDYGVTPENKTLHLVKGSAPRNTGDSSSGGATATPTSTYTPTPTPSTMAPMSNPPSQGIPNLMPGGQPASLASMREQLMQNPEMMGNLMNNPAIRSLMSNPDVMRSMMESNPEMRQVMDSNPQLRHILDDPEMMRRSMEMMRDPSAMQNMMRNQDLAMSQIENLPGGFNALRRMYEDVQEPMMEAMAGSAAPSAESATSSSNNSRSAPGGAMPNPWGANPATSNNNTSSGTSTPASSAPFNPWAMPNLPTPGVGGANPAGADAANPFAPGMNPPNMEQTMQMLENPLFQNMMNGLMSDPATLQQMTEQNPYLQQMRSQNPAAAAMFSNPETMREMMNPNNLRAMMQIQQGMQGLQGSNLLNTLPGMPPSGTSGAPGTGNTAPSNLDFSQMLNQLQNTSMSSPAADTSSIPPEERYRVPLQSLVDMGFANREQNLRVLQQAHGNVNRAVDLILAEPLQPAERSEGSTDNNDGEQQN